MYQLSVQRIDDDMYVDSEQIAKVICRSFDFVEGMIQVINVPCVAAAMNCADAKIKEASYRDNITCELITTHKLNKDALACFFLVLPMEEGADICEAYSRLFDALEKSDKQFEYIMGELGPDNHLTKMNLVSYPLKPTMDDLDPDGERFLHGCYNIEPN